MPRYRFGDFLLSPQQRILQRSGAEQPLIPRYFDLLLFLIEHRHEAVHRRDIFDHVWRDVVVSDSALTQAIRTIRRVLDDDPREPRFIRTVSRHGYRFVFDAVVEESDADPPAPRSAASSSSSSSASRAVPSPPGQPRPEPERERDSERAAWPEGAAEAAPAPAPPSPAPPAAGGEERAVDPFAPLIQRLADDTLEDEERIEAAEMLHQLGTSEALARLDRRPASARARAILRDARWDAPGAGPVPIAGGPEPVRTSLALVGLRLRRAARIAAGRGLAAAVGGGAAGVVAGGIGGLLLAVMPDGSAPPALAVVLAVVGGVCGMAGGAGVGGGISIAEAVARSQRAPALAAGAAIGGALIGALAQLLGYWTLASIFGVHVAIGGSVEGLAIGAAAGLGFAVATRDAHEGLAAPRGRRRAVAIAWVATACGLAAIALSLAGRPLVGGTIHEIANSSNGSRAALTSLGRLVGEPDFGPVSRALLSVAEGATFGVGLAAGLTRRRRR